MLLEATASIIKPANIFRPRRRSYVTTRSLSGSSRAAIYGPSITLKLRTFCQSALLVDSGLTTTTASRTTMVSFMLNQEAAPRKLRTQLRKEYPVFGCEGGRYGGHPSRHL